MDEDRFTLVKYSNKQYANENIRGARNDTQQVSLRIEAFLSLKSKETARTYRGILRCWCEFLATQSNSDNTADTFIKATDLEATLYKAWLEKRPGQIISRSTSNSTKNEISTQVRPEESRDGYQSTLSNSTIAKHFAALRRIYRMLMSYDFGIARNPFDPDRIGQIAKNSGQKRPTEMIPFADVQKLIAVPDEKTPKGLRDKVILSLLFGGGLRRSEVIKIRLGDLKRTQRGVLYLHLRTTKAKQDAYQSLPDWANIQLEKLLESRKEDGAKEQDYLVTSYRGKGGTAPTHFPLSDSGLYKLFKSYCKIAGITHRVSPHSARATAITKLLDDGISHREVQEFSRHASVQMVEAYDKKRAGIEQNPGRNLDY